MTHSYARGRRLLTLTLLAGAILAAGVVPVPRAQALVYWGNSGDGTISRAHLDGSNVQDFISGIDDPCGVAVNGAHIYWADFDGDRIGRANLSGTGVDRDFITGLVDPCGIAIDGENVYWSTCSSTGAVGRAELDGTNVDEDFITATDEPCGVGVDANYVYWANCDNPGSIGRADLDGTDPVQSFISGTDTPCGEIAVNASSIFWTNSGSSEAVARADLAGTNPDQDFIAAVSTPFGVAASATHLYWVNFGVDTATDSIGRSTIGGANVEQGFIADVNRPQGIAVDALTSFPLPSNEFSFGKLKRNKERGTATLTVEVPSAGTVKLAGKGIKKREASVTDGTPDPKLKVRAKGDARRELDGTGRARVRAKVTYTPTAPITGEPNTETKRVKLVKRL